MFRKYCGKKVYFFRNSKLSKMTHSSKHVLNYCELSSSQCAELGFKFIEALGRRAKMTDFTAR